MAGTAPHARGLHTGEMETRERAATKRRFLAWWLCLSFAARCYADGGFLPPADYTGKDLSEPCQRAVLIHRNGKETLLLFVDYRGGADRFAWIVPCPAKPSVRTADIRILREVAQYYQHLRLLAWHEKMKRRKGESGGGAPPGAPEVSVHLTKVIGPYEIAVLSSTRARALAGWLRNNGYRVPKRAEPVLQLYIKEKWFFAAIKVRAERGRDVTLKPLRLDFETRTPVYPLRITAVTRGVTDVRLYLLQLVPAHASLPESPYQPIFQVKDDITTRCPTLVKAVPQVDWRHLAITRIHETLVPQVMTRLDDRIHTQWVERPGRPGRTVPLPSIYPAFVDRARIEGIAEALMSDDPHEAAWAEKNIFFYYYAKSSPGELPAAQLAALAEIGKRFGAALRDRLIAMVAEGARSRGHSVKCEGAMVLLARTASSADPAVIACLEKTAGTVWHGSAATNALRTLGSPASRRALVRVALSKSNHRVGAAFRYVYSLGENTIDQAERRLASKELLTLLSNGIARGEAKRRALKLLRDYTTKDFGKDWDAWSGSLGAEPRSRHAPTD